MRGPVLSVALGVVLALVSAASAAAQAPACDPFTTPSFRGEVPTAQQVLGIDLGDRDVTTAESDRYLLRRRRAPAPRRHERRGRAPPSRAARCATRSSGAPSA